MTNEEAKSYLTVLRKSYINQLKHLKESESIFYCSEFIQAFEIAIKALESEGREDET